MVSEGLAAKIIGVLSGAFLALVFDPPRSRLSFARRAGAAIVAGYIFGHLALAFMGWAETFENMMAAWCLAAFGSWSGIGRIKGLIETYKRDDR